MALTSRIHTTVRYVRPISASYPHDLVGHGPKVKTVLQLVSSSEALNLRGGMSMSSAPALSFVSSSLGIYPLPLLLS
jgi:hypothetical protein